MVNDYFIGREVSTLNADKFTIEHIEEDMIALDRELMDKKYWDYKLWHPMVATMYFCHRYHTIAARIMERECGDAEGKKYRAIAANYDLRKMKLATIRGFWKARQAADAIGCHYDVFIRACIRNFRNNIKLMASHKANRKQRLPYPQQLVSTFAVEEALKDWTAEKRKRFPMPTHEDIANNRDLWFRPEMEAWLEEEARRQDNPTYWLKECKALGMILGPNTSHTMIE